MLEFLEIRHEFQALLRARSIVAVQDTDREFMDGVVQRVEQFVVPRDEFLCARHVLGSFAGA